MEQLRLGDGSEVSYRVIGEGFPIIGMPGGPGVSAGYVYSFAEPLLDRLTWYLIDPPGTGASTPSVTTASAPTLRSTGMSYPLSAWTRP